MKNKIQTARQSRQWSVADLADRISVSPRTVEGWEQGKRPSRLAKKLLVAVMPETAQTRKNLSARVGGKTAGGACSHAKSLATLTGVVGDDATASGNHPRPCCPTCGSAWPNPKCPNCQPA